MRKYLLSSLMVLATLMTSCYNDDELRQRLDELEQNQDQLEQDLARLEAEYKAALDSTINAIGEDISGLQQDILDLGTADEEIIALLGEVDNTIAEIEETIAEGGDEVFYGNLYSQADYDAFAAGNYTIVSGGVVIDTDAEMAALANVISIGNELTIANNSFEALALESLKMVSGTVRIANNNSLASVQMPNLVLAGSFIVEGNEAIASVIMPKLGIVNHDLSIIDNVGDGGIGAGGASDPTELSVIELPELISLGNNFTINKTILTSLVLNNLTLVEGNYLIENNGRLAQIANFKLAKVEGDYQVEGNLLLASMVYPALTEVSGDFIMTGNSGHLELANNNLSNIFDALSYVGGNFYAAGAFNNFDGFNSLAYIGGHEFSIGGFVGSYARGFDVFVGSQSGSVSVYLNAIGAVSDAGEAAAPTVEAYTENFTEVDFLNNIGVVNSLVIGSDVYISDLSGFNNLRTIENYFVIGNFENYRPESVKLDSLVASGPANIEQISGFQSLENIGVNQQLYEITDFIGVSNGANTNYVTREFNVAIGVISTTGTGVFCGLENAISLLQADLDTGFKIGEVYFCHYHRTFPGVDYNLEAYPVVDPFENCL